jgi:hypothetical protein
MNRSQDFAFTAVMLPLFFASMSIVVQVAQAVI